ncbi:MAG: glucosamine--fructose-6-phosphate aminotransferase [Gammaproteobacteria bacterium]|nr:glucosamine--fructose-6-phosphate aminotransferase [Gammaproteobacteria bacterium]MBU1654457.1 glucosamine--fructose-6-phosphate aminotransferase [Gammaproteobacteria bacterium]MBU1962615.1 glucosamine--fructose-6-phosphate aminotransferase [Gammaproteobacteria bacterium]
MARLEKTLNAWGDETFAQTLKGEIEALPSASLPLASGTGYVEGDGFSVTILHAAADREAIRARIGVFFSEIMAGCSCGDEPVPTSAYCELLVTIDKSTAEAIFTPMPEGSS